MADENTDASTDDGADSKPAGDSGAADGAEKRRMQDALRKANAEAKTAREELASLKATIAAGKTDAERTAGQIADLQAQVKETNLRAMRAEVAASRGLTPAQARRLQGETIEALESDADELIAAFKPAAPADGAGAQQGTEGTAAQGGGDANGGQRQSAARPKENLRPGTATTSADAGDGYDSKAFLAAVPRG